MTKRFANLIVIISIVLVDQISKLIVIQSLTENTAIKVNQILNIVLVYNSGAAFGILSNASGWQNTFFIIATFVILIVIFIFILNAKRKIPKLELLSFRLIVAGAIGNLIDRLYLGKVVDFIDFHWQQYHYPAFNVADSAITIGVFIMILSFIYNQKSE